MDPTPEIIAEMASLPDICQRAGVDDDLFARMSFSMGGTPTHARNVALIPGQAWDLALLNLPNTATAGANVTPAGGPKPLEWGCLPALRRVTHLVCGLDPNEPQTDGSFILTNSGPEPPTAQQQGIPPSPNQQCAPQARRPCGAYPRRQARTYPRCRNQRHVGPLQTHFRYGTIPRN
jgi:hypothetical protein